jgi:hypothetical protein
MSAKRTTHTRPPPIDVQIDHSGNGRRQQEQRMTETGISIRSVDVPRWSSGDVGWGPFTYSLRGPTICNERAIWGRYGLTFPFVRM